MRLTKEIIIKTASDIVDRDGLNKLSLKRLAEELGIRSPSLYNHVSCLDDLWREVAHNGMKKMNFLMKEAAIGKSGNEAIKCISGAYLNYMISHPGVYEAIQWSVWNGNKETENIFNDYKEFLMKLIVSCNLKNGDNNVILNLLIGILHGYTTMQLGEAIKNPNQIITDFKNTMDIVLLGISEKYK